MKYTNSIEISIPRTEVVRLLSDPTLRPQWLRGLVLHEPLSGSDGQPGTTSRVVFQTGKQTMECTETITRREPDTLDEISTETDVLFERKIVADGMESVTLDRLYESSPSRTIWTSDEEYRFTGAMKLLASVMRCSFTKQSRRHLQDFKAFAEHGIDVRDTKD